MHDRTAFRRAEAYQLYLAYETLDRDRVVGYMDRILRRAGWQLKPRVSDGCAFGGSGGGWWVVDYEDVELTVTCSAEGRRLSVTVLPRDLALVPSPAARLGSDVLRAVRRAIS